MDNIGKVCKRRHPFAAFTTRLLYGKSRTTSAMGYDISESTGVSPSATVSLTGLHISRNHPWLETSADGMVLDPSHADPHGLLEIKCLYMAKEGAVCTEEIFLFLEV